jgi:hypothetical protein
MRETVFGTPATPVTGADRFRLIDSAGLKLSRANIVSQERRSDQLENIGRLGGISIEGVINSEINPGGDFDLLIEDLVRGTWGALGENTDIDAGGVGVGTEVREVDTPATPIYRSYTIEQYDIDIDQSELFTGMRLTQADFSLQPGEMANISWRFQGQNRQVLQTAASPYFTAPDLTAGLPLIADDAVITYQGSPILVATGLNFTQQTDAAGQPVIGSFLSPDVFMNMHRINGTISAVREDLDALDDFDAETEFELKVVMQAPTAPPRLTFAFIMPVVKIRDIDANLIGGDAAKVETRQFAAHPEPSLSNAIQYYSSTETPIIV